VIDPADPHVEIVASFELPLSIDLFVLISGAVTEALEGEGWTDVVIRTDGPGNRIAARRPGAPPRQPAADPAPDPSKHPAT